MSVLDFDVLKPTTMTLIAQLTGTVALDWAFSLLPITRIVLPEQKRHKQKIKLPHVNMPGSILSLRHKGHTRGIIRSTNSKFFKNSVTIDIGCREKNLCLKLSGSKFQICGAASVAQGREGITYIVDKLNDIQNELEYIAENQEKAVSTLQVLKEITKGYAVIRTETESTSVSTTTDGVPAKEQTDFTIRYIEDLNTYASDDFDTRIAQFLYRQCFDFNYHSHFATEIDYILTVRMVATKGLAVSSICEAMVNLNYDLGYNVDRTEFCNAVNGVEGFYARYNNMLEHSVTVHLPYEPPDSRKLLRKKNKQPCHTFIVYQSGLVTQSGPGGELMREAYYKFNELAGIIRDDVMIRDHPRKFKYTPSYGEQAVIAPTQATLTILEPAALGSPENIGTPESENAVLDGEDDEIPI